MGNQKAKHQKIPTPTDPLRRIGYWGHLWLVLLIGGLGALGWRVWDIQQSMGSQLLSYRDERQKLTMDIPARRGMIFDRRGRILAGSKMQSSVFADPQMVEAPAMAAELLAPILHRPAEELRQMIETRAEKRFVWLARKIADEEAQAIEQLKLPGIHLQQEPQRIYPNGSVGAHVLGFVDIDGLGLEGIEKKFNTVLSGTPGQYVTTCDVRRRPLWTEAEQVIQPIDGQHLILTIDLVIQGYLEDALEKAIKKYQAQSGIGIVISPATGEVLAMASFPDFDPNAHAEYPADAKRNRCLTDPVEPGSCFKPFVLAAGLAEKVISLSEKYDCGLGVKYFGKRRLRDTHPNHVLTFEEVLVKSSNIGMAEVGTRLGNKRLHAYLSALGFGKPTGVELPGEDGGILLPLTKWTSYSTTSVPMGQEVAVTPMQIAAALAALVNDGEYHTPRLVHAVLDSDGTGYQMASQPEIRQAIPAAFARQVAQQAMVAMVNESSHDVKLASYQVLGKTGTAQIPYRNRRGYEPDAYLSTFMGAAPAQEPQVAVLIQIRKPNRKIGYYGGTVSGPAVKEVLANTLAYWQIPPDAEAMTVAASAQVVTGDD